MDQSPPSEKKLETLLLWDYDMSLEEFFDRLHGRTESDEWLGQTWAIARAINQLNYYDLRRLVPLQLIAEHWRDVKPQIRSEQVKQGIEYVLRKRG